MSGMLRILVANGKGGCGKTTIATNLAAAFARRGYTTGLAETDRQKSSLAWLRSRDIRAAPIRTLDWRKDMDEPGPELQRLVIDAPANLRLRHVDELIRAADLIIVPVLPSVFDEGGTARFLAKLAELKPVRKGHKGIALVANRVRLRSKAAQRLDAFLAGLGHPVVARLTDRALYGELAAQGLSIFDLDSRAAHQVRLEWRPLLQAIDEAEDGPSAEAGPQP